MNFLYHYFTELWILTLEMSPYLLLGFFFAGLLKAVFPKSWIDRYMGKNDFKSVVNASLLGIPLPLCSCGVIPTGISLHKNGASKGASVSFLISTPQTGVDSILVTYSMLGLPFAIIRVIVALITGVIGGLLTNLLPSKDQIKEAPLDSCKTEIKEVNRLLTIVRYGFYEFLMDIAKWLIIGLLLAALIAVLIPDNFFTTYLDNRWLSMLIALLASVPLYICATASVPVAAVLMLKGLSPGAALIILMAGPATNIATITVIKKVFGNKTFYTYLGSIIGGAFIFGAIINELLPREWFISMASASNTHCTTGCEDPTVGFHPFYYISAILLIGLIINGYVQKFIQKRKQKGAQVITPQNYVNKPNVAKGNFTAFKPVSTNSTTLKVTGMTCSHCKNSVESNVGKLPGVDSVIANPAQNSVVISGKDVDINEVKKVINSLGYNCE